RAVDEDALRAVGTRRGQRWASAAATVVPVAVGGAALAALAAVLASPLFPVGVAREAEPDPGLHVDATALALGSVAIVLVVSALGAVSALVTTRRNAARTVRPGRPTTVLAGTGFPPTFATGVGF